jgi:hypothetical protein
MWIWYRGDVFDISGTRIAYRTENNPNLYGNATYKNINIFSQKLSEGIIDFV